MDMNKLAAARKYAGLTQEQAAAKLGTTVRTWCRWEGGATTGWMGRLDDIAAILGCAPESLRPDEPLSEIGALREEVAELRAILLERLPLAS